MATEQAVNGDKRRGLANLSEIDDKGIRFVSDELITPPHIIWEHRAISSVKLYVSDAELGALSDTFGIGGQILNGAGFEHDPQDPVFKATIGFRPIVSRLMDPGWMREYIDWRLDPVNNPLPQPNPIPWYLHWLGSINMPGYSESVSFDPRVVKERAGMLDLKVVEGRAYGIFNLGGKQYSYRLTPEGFAYAALRDDGGTFDQREMLKIFGPRPKMPSYGFSRKFDKRGRAGFGSVSSIKLCVTLSKRDLGKFDLERLYYFEMRRDNGRIKIECYDSPAEETRKLLAEAFIILSEGCPRNNEQQLTCV
jgi:hypothetical protein